VQVWSIASFLLALNLTMGNPLSGTATRRPARMSASGSTRSVAGILAGSLRFGNRRHLDAFLRATADYELHVATYASGAALASTLTCSLLLIPVLPASMPTTMMQWVNLQAAVRYFRHRISPHIRSIVRLRTDVRLLPALLPHPPPNMLYAFTDRVFYAERSTFLRLFSDIGDASQFRYTSSLPPRSTPLGGRDQEILQRMLLANGTDAHSGGCVHPCERLSQRECPHTRWHRLPWRWAPPTDALCGVWPNVRSLSNRSVAVPSYVRSAFVGLPANSLSARLARHSTASFVPRRPSHITCMPVSPLSDDPHFAQYPI
jgi:hypothetical protein